MRHMENKARKRRLELGMTQLALAKAAGTSREYINRIEMGRVVSPGIKICKKIAAALEVTIGDLWQ